VALKRRNALLALLSLGAVSPRFALPQPRTVRIGFLAPRQRSVFLPAVLKRLAELGYVEGSNLVLEYRSADGVVARFPSLARDLIETKCDLIFAVGAEEAARALLEAKTEIPIVILAAGYDPVKTGIVSSLRRPGGNVTGMFIPLPAIAAKHVELMREIVPKAKRYFVLADVFTKDNLDRVREAAERLQLQIVVETFATPPYDLEPAFAKGRTAGSEALIVLDSATFFDHRRRIAQLAMKHRLPSVVNVHYFDEPGFLISYGVNFYKAFSRAGDIAVSIIKGAKPAEIPLEQPTEFELAINLNTANALGISVPRTMLARADRVIR
jgi:putative ABC transport system substrate-binding protein